MHGAVAMCMLSKFLCFGLFRSKGRAFGLKVTCQLGSPHIVGRPIIVVADVSTAGNNVFDVAAPGRDTMT